MEGITNLLVAACIAGTLWLAVRTIANFQRRRNSRRMERGLAEYLRQKQ